MAGKIAFLILSLVAIAYYFGLRTALRERGLLRWWDERQPKRIEGGTLGDQIGRPVLRRRRYDGDGSAGGGGGDFPSWGDDDDDDDGPSWGGGGGRSGGGGASGSW